MPTLSSYSRPGAVRGAGGGPFRLAPGELEHAARRWRLTPLERDVFAALLDCLPTRAIARSTGHRETTIRKLQQAIYAKVGADGGLLGLYRAVADWRDRAPGASGLCPVCAAPVSTDGGTGAER